jgi:hypothetical protein
MGAGVLTQPRVMRIHHHRVVTMPQAFHPSIPFDERFMDTHAFVEPDGSFWRGLCPKCGKPREHPGHIQQGAQSAVELTGVSARQVPPQPRRRSA